MVAKPRPRQLIVDLDEGITDEDYRHLANLIWLLLKTAKIEGVITPDEGPLELNDSWREYQREARWGAL